MFAAVIVKKEVKLRVTIAHKRMFVSVIFPHLVNTKENISHLEYKGSSVKYDLSRNFIGCQLRHPSSDWSINMSAKNFNHVSSGRVTEPKGD